MSNGSCKIELFLTATLAEILPLTSCISSGGIGWLTCRLNVVFNSLFYCVTMFKWGCNPTKITKNFARKFRCPLIPVEDIGKVFHGFQEGFVVYQPLINMYTESLKIVRKSDLTICGFHICLYKNPRKNYRIPQFNVSGYPRYVLIFVTFATQSLYSAGVKVFHCRKGNANFGACVD